MPKVTNDDSEKEKRKKRKSRKVTEMQLPWGLQLARIQLHFFSEAFIKRPVWGNRSLFYT